jgi:hypothetical protein
MLPAAAMGFMVVLRTKQLFHIDALLWFAATPMLGWIGVVLFGFVGNASMRRALERRLIAAGEDMKRERYFVGAARPSYSSALDPHEDVGFLIFAPDRLIFVGDSLRIEVKKNSIIRIVRKANAHSWLFLGGWIAIEGAVDGKPIRLLVEPREKPLVIQNKPVAVMLKRRLEEWLRQP